MKSFKYHNFNLKKKKERKTFKANENNLSHHKICNNKNNKWNIQQSHIFTLQITNHQ